VPNPANEHLQDLNAREYATLIPLVILAFSIGIYPKPLFRVLDRPVQLIVEQANPGYYGAERAAAAAANRSLTPEQVDTRTPAMPGMPGMQMPAPNRELDDDANPRQFDPKANGGGR